MPLGSVERFAVYQDGAGDNAGGPKGTFTATTVVDRLEQLAPTPANLAELNPAAKR